MSTSLEPKRLGERLRIYTTGLSLASIRKGVQSSTLARNASWSFIGQIASSALQAGYFIFVARLLGSANYGIYTAAFALVSIVSQYSSLGSGYVFLRNVSVDRSKHAQYWGCILLTTLSFGTALLVIIVLLGRAILPHDPLLLLLYIAIGDTICQQLISTTSQVFQTFEELRAMAIVNIMVNVLRFVLVLALITTMQHANPVQWAFASMLISVAAAVVTVSWATIRFGIPELRGRLVFKHLSEGVTFSLTGSTSYIYNDVDKVMLGHFGMNAASGFYTAAYRILNIFTTPISSVHNAAFPRFFQRGVQGAIGVMPFAQRILRKTVLFGIAGAVIMFITAPLVPSLVGKSFNGIVPALRWLCLIPLLRCFHLSAGDALAGAGHQNIRLGSRVVAAVFNFIVNLFLIPKFGWLGAAWASLLTDGGLGILDWVILGWLVAREKNKSALTLESA